MTDHSLVPLNPTVPPEFYLAQSDRVVDYRLRKYADYISEQQHSNWTTVNLQAYADYLGETLSPASILAHLSTVRQGLERIYKDRDYWFSKTPANMSFVEKQAWVNEVTVRYANALTNKITGVKKQKFQDRADSDFIRLTIPQQIKLLKLPPRTDKGSLAGLRDAALIGLALATGLRNDELCRLEVDDLRQTLAGELAVLVRDGKGGKQRLVPYGAEVGVLDLIEQWFQRAGIENGFVFRGVTNKGNVLDEGITTRTFERRLARYVVDGLIITPHDLRRTYAKNRYLQDMDILAIRDNLGHEDVKTTQTYIGATDVEKRIPVQGLTYI